MTSDNSRDTGVSSYQVWSEPFDISAARFLPQACETAGHPWHAQLWQTNKEAQMDQIWSRVTCMKLWQDVGWRSLLLQFPVILNKKKKTVSGRCACCFCHRADKRFPSVCLTWSIWRWLIPLVLEALTLKLLTKECTTQGKRKCQLWILMRIADVLCDFCLSETKVWDTSFSGVFCKHKYISSCVGSGPLSINHDNEEAGRLIIICINKDITYH